MNGESESPDGSAVAARAAEIVRAVKALPPEGAAEMTNRLCGADGRLRDAVARELAKSREKQTADGQPNSEALGSGPTAAISTSHDAHSWPSGNKGGDAAVAGAGRRRTAMLASTDKEVEPLDHIGPYRIAREIGRGGFGVVYLGILEGERFRKQAAVKVLKRGVDTDSVIRRFELERQLLASLTHPNIAQLFDGGMTRDGRPYFAMEYVEGMRIDEYCDRHRLGIDERLSLFKQVCAAVQCAHRNLIVHRDLTPRNILVTSDGIPKLLDFGIAKLLNPGMSPVHNDPTAPELQPMTPEYASPEQVRGEPITTATDIYSLGVILYELLTGHRPYSITRRVRAEIERAVCTQDPVAPSVAVEQPLTQSMPAEESTPATRTMTAEELGRARNARPVALRRRLSGDLDNIVLMAMRKEPNRRYSSVERFVEDIDRHLRKLPVAARPNELGYRLFKFAGRHRIGLAVALLFGTAIVAAAWGAFSSVERERLRLQLEVGDLTQRQTTLELESTQAREKAKDELVRERATLVRELLQTMDQVYSKVERVGGSAELKELIVDSTTEAFDRLEPANDSERQQISRDRAGAYDRLGTYLVGRRTSGAARVDLGLAAHLRAKELRAPLLEKGAPDVELLCAAALNRVQIATALKSQGKLDDAHRELEEARGMLEPIVERDPTNLRPRRIFSTTLNDLATLAREKGDTDRSLDLARRSVEFIRETMRLAPKERAVLRDYTVALGRLATALAGTGNYPEAVRLRREVLDLRIRIHEEEPTDRNLRDVAVAEYALGDLLFHMKQVDDAEPLLRRYMENSATIAARGPDDRSASVDLAFARWAWARCLVEKSRFDEALVALTLADEGLRPIAEADTSNLQVLSRQAKVWALAGSIYHDKGDRERSLSFMRRARDAYRRMVDRSPTNEQWGEELANIERALQEMATASP